MVASKHFFTASLSDVEPVTFVEKRGEIGHCPQT